MISPFRPFVINWRIFLQFINVGWHAIFWLRVAFGPLNQDLGALPIIEAILDCFILVDVILRFFTGVPYNEIKLDRHLRGDGNETIDDTEFY